MKNIVIIGGGTGTFTLLSGLKNFPVNNSVIVSSADDGGSTGRLRKELGVFPPGDLRQCLLGLSEGDNKLKEIFNYRFQKGELKGHNAGNIILAALEKITGDISSAVAAASKLLKVRGSVIPVTLRPTMLEATLGNGKKIVGEHNIDQPRRIKNNRLRIKNLQLKPLAPANPKAISALKAADVIVFGPGDLHTSIIPNLLAQGIKEAIDASKARKILVTGLMTRPGQTDGFRPLDFVNEVNKYLGKKKLEAVLVNTAKPSGAALAKYKKTGAEFVWPEVLGLKGIKIIKAELLSPQVVTKPKGDTLERSFLRHDPHKLAKIIYKM
jgi:uncharacterized cofD-like protein